MMKIIKRSGSIFSYTFILITVNVLIYFAALIISFFVGHGDFSLGYQKTTEFLALNPSKIVHGQALWTFLTSMFMHGSPFHLFANMLSLMFLGGFVERLVGKKRFLGVYFASGIAGSLFFVLSSYLSADLNVYAVGASGAIFGLAGMLAILTPRLPVYIMFIPIAMPMWFGVIIIMLSLWILSTSLNLPIGNTAHLGGLMIGLIYAYYLRTKYKEKAALIRKYYS